MYVLGLQGGNNRTHDASACLLLDDKIIAFAEEERFIRSKKAFDRPPIFATKFCLDEAKITMKDIDSIAFAPSHHVPEAASIEELTREFFPKKLFGEIGKPKIFYFDHHLAHAASVYFTSGFEDAAVLVVDGSGVDVATSIYRASNGELELVSSYPISESLGFLYAGVSSYLGFGTFGAGKLMGLSSYGEPFYVREISKIFNEIKNKNNTQINTQREYIDETHRLLKRYGFDAPLIKETRIRAKNKVIFTPELKQIHRNLAASTQQFLEAKMIELALGALQGANSKNLCLSGGVALNCVANSVMENIIKPKNMFIQPACEDSGISLGAALLVTGRQTQYKSPYLGISYFEEEIKEYLDSTKAKYQRINNPSKKAADLLSKGKIVGWFNGKMEAGPRALGNRSILAHPGLKKNNKAVNLAKGRELWRPFGPSVLLEKGQELFEHYTESPFMLKSFEVKKNYKSSLAAVTHVDNTTRPQTVNKLDNPDYHQLINHFYKKTGIPAVLNTSFNYAGEPLVCSIEDALKTFTISGLNCLFIGNYLVIKENKNEEL
jgi:carbamoyltransferase